MFIYIDNNLYDFSPNENNLQEDFEDPLLNIQYTYFI